MTQSRAELVAWAKDTIAHGSRSFSMASLLLPRRERENAWLLYAWCRTCDDVTDDQLLGMTRPDGAMIDAGDIDALTRRALDGDLPVPPAYAALRLVQRDAGIPRSAIESHLAGFALDRAGWHPQSFADLERYCFHVAGAVGLMMAVIMGVDPDDRDTLGRASDLGLAFQLNNIARDLVEDAEAGRCYVPQEWLERAGVTMADLADPANRPILAGFARRMQGRALIYDQSARVGAARLSPRCRMAILAAANIYGGIGTAVVARGPAAWEKRVRTSTGDKLGAIARAATQSLGTPPDISRAGLFDPFAV
ncbi:phytoene/squalene synthase family protein [Altererythrobacter xixiisoli]|uniref:Phytoene/squalene synthase family protein n=1 Tax=Croceibacterium xixiisoli TaxID=1476466 RepID=A0A6I4TSQ0_9SPHN|nr:phytoene/squalene synthase family protein [Croceibacterium xixiisoli]MXO99175.1 phytoene/squalene synthase family protein [Croceibacterium xixiisoli]